MADYPDFEGGKSGVYSVAEWAAFEGNDKTLIHTGTNKASGLGSVGSYAVPSDKTLYIISLSFEIHATNATDRDNNQTGVAALYRATPLTIYCYFGGNGGGSILFGRPIKFATGEGVRYGVSNWSNHNCDYYITVWGYEVS